MAADLNVPSVNWRPEPGRGLSPQGRNVLVHASCTFPAAAHQEGTPAVPQSQCVIVGGKQEMHKKHHYYKTQVLSRKADDKLYVIDTMCS